MSLPSQDELEQSLMQVAAGVHAVLPTDLDRHAELEVTFSEGDAVIEVEEDGNMTRKQMRVRELQKKLNKAKAKLEEKQQRTAQTQTETVQEEQTTSTTTASSSEDLHDGVKDTILG